jgi:hypothetical protein
VTDIIVKMRFAGYSSEVLKGNSSVYNQTGKVYDSVDLILTSEFKNPSNTYRFDLIKTFS